MTTRVGFRCAWCARRVTARAHHAAAEGTADAVAMWGPDEEGDGLRADEGLINALTRTGVLRLLCGAGYAFRWRNRDRWTASERRLLRVYADAFDAEWGRLEAEAFAD